MRFKKLIYIFLMCALLHLLGACTGGGYNLNVEVSPSDKSLIDLSSITYDGSQLSQIARFNGSIADLNALYPIECLRNEDFFIRVSYLGSDSVVIMLFDKLGAKLSGKVYSTQRLSADFGNLTVGQSLEEVMELDPSGEYLFLYSGRNDVPKVSSHYTRDGFLFTVEYDESNSIIAIREELI